jgi:hypothetical protein
MPLSCSPALVRFALSAARWAAFGFTIAATLQTPTDLLAQIPALAVSVEVSPNPGLVGNEVLFTARVERTVPQNLYYYGFFISGEQLPGWQTSPQYRYTPTRPGPHIVHVEIARRVPSGPARGGKAGVNQFEMEVVGSSQRRTFNVNPQPDVPAPPPAVTVPEPPIIEPPSASPILGLTLLSPSVTAGESAAFRVSVEGVSELPEYIFDAGDGTPPQRLRDAAVEHIYARSDVYTARVSLPDGIAGPDSIVQVNVAQRELQPAPLPPPEGPTPPPPPPPPSMFWWWLAGAIVVVGAILLAKFIQRPSPVIAGAPTFHPKPDFEPHFVPAKPRGIRFEVHMDRNLTSLVFTPQERRAPRK